MVTLTPEEMQEMTPADLKAHAENEARIVFGHDYKKDANGNPVEVGIGAPGHGTANSYLALQMAEGKEIADAARARDAALKAKKGE
jgi:hypothetical protein